MWVDILNDIIHQDSTRNVTSASDLWHQDSLQICIDNVL